MGELGWKVDEQQRRLYREQIAGLWCRVSGRGAGGGRGCGLLSMVEVSSAGEGLDDERSMQSEVGAWKERLQGWAQ